MFKIIAISALFCLGQVSGISLVHRTPTAEEQEKLNLCYGYDVTAGRALYQPNSLKYGNAIIDPNSDYLNHAIYINSNSAETDSFRSYSYDAVNKQYANSLGANASVGASFGKMASLNTNLDTAFNKDVTVSNATTTTYDVYSNIIRRHSYIIAEMSTSEIRKCLSKRFADDLNKVDSIESAKMLFDTYGTHLNTGYTYGGVFQATNYVVTQNSTYNLAEVKSLAAQITYVQNSISIGAGTSLSEQFRDNTENSETKTTYNQKAYGGYPLTTFTLEQLFVYNSSILDVEKSGYYFNLWTNSIARNEDLVIVEVPYSANAQSIPIWNLLVNNAENSIKRGYLMDAYMELCGDEYEEYQNKYKQNARDLYLEDEDEAAQTSFNQVFIRTPNDYFYSVDKDDLFDKGKHYELHNGDMLYFNFEHKTSMENISLDKNGTSGVELVGGDNGPSLKQGIFKVTGTNGNATIRLRYGSGTDMTTQLIINTPIKPKKFEGGVGNDKYPYLIATPEQLSNVSSDLTAKYLLVADLDFEGIDNFYPIGNFKGEFDGNYCTISNLSIKNDPNNWGIFSSNEGTITNLIVNNSGSNTSLSSWKQNGFDLTNASGSNFKNGSISSLNAGIICGVNKGSIENVYINNCYIRNMVTNPESKQIDKVSGGFYDNGQLVYTYTGGVCGYNAGTLSNVMVKDIAILTNLETNKEGGSYDLVFESYSGGLVGKNVAGKISSCAIELTSNGYVKNRLYITDKGYNTFTDVASCGIAGMVDGDAEILNTYSYLNVSNTGVDVLLKKEGNYYWHCNRLFELVSFALTENSNPTCSNVYGYSNNSTFPVKPYRVDKKNNSESYSTPNYNATEVEGLVETRLVASEGNFKELNLSEPMFFYDSSSQSISHVGFMLSKSRSDYMLLSVNQLHYDDVKDNFYVGEYFSACGLSFTRRLFDDLDEDVKVFRLSSYGEEDLLDELFAEHQASNKYELNVSLYGNGDEVKLPSKFQISVNPNEITKIFYEGEEGADPRVVIEYTGRQDFIDNFGFDTLPLKAVLTNGSIISIDSSTNLLKNARLTLESINSVEDILKGDNIVTVKYGNTTKSFTAEFILECNDHQVRALKIKQNPTKTVYDSDQMFDCKGLVVEVEYEDTESTTTFSGRKLEKNLEFTGGMISCGQNKVLVTYQDYRIIASIEVAGIGEDAPAEPTLVKLDASGAVSLFYVGDAFSSNGLVITATYSDGNTANIPVSECQITPPDMSSAGTKTVVINYGGLVCSYEIIVQEKVEPPVDQVKLTGIGLTKMPKTTFYVGDEFTSEGLQVTAMYSDGSSKVVVPVLSSPNMNIAGKQTVIVQYAEGGITKTAEYEITVVEQTIEEKVLTGIVITTPATQLTFNKGDNFNYIGLVVTAMYSDGSTSVITPVIIEPNMNVVGQQGVVVKYTEGDVTKTITYTIEVKEEEKPEAVIVGIEVTTEPTKTTFDFGETFTYEGLVVSAIYSDGTRKVLTEGYTVYEPNMNVSKLHHVAVVYQGFATSYSIYVMPEKTEEPSSQSKGSGGCGGSIIASSVAISAISIFGLALLTIRKKEDKE